MQPPDFGSSTSGGVGLDLGIVEPTLGPDDTPVYAGNPTTPSTHGSADFAQWFHDAADNLTTSVSLPFGPAPSDPSAYASLNPEFFPVDNQLFGNEGPHNYYFTAALVVSFRYHGGETFHLTSDDDSWLFINRKLAVDLGGVHQAMAGSVDLDSQREALGIAVGQTYPMHVFYADRHPIAAVLDIQVPAADFAVCSDGGLP
jgi:fibro-slime domain-containing protein